jgi:hypothetical protein
MGLIGKPRILKSRKYRKMQMDVPEDGDVMNSPISQN